LIFIVVITEMSTQYADIDDDDDINDDFDDDDNDDD
jgi:hypothetical protein